MTAKYELRTTEAKGEGVFATQPFKAGELIMEGIIDQEFDYNTSHSAQIGLNRYVRHKGIIHKVNHSCDPNCGIKLHELGGHNFVAMRDIAVGEEICLDYAMRNYRIEFFPYECCCGAKNCRKRITGWVGLPEDRRKAYAGFVAPYLYELDELHARENRAQAV